MAHRHEKISQFWPHPSTQLVDIFVENYHPSRVRPPPMLGLNRTTKNLALKTVYKSTTCACLLRFAALPARFYGALWICAEGFFEQIGGFN